MEQKHEMDIFRFFMEQVIVEKCWVECILVLWMIMESICVGFGLGNIAAYGLVPK
jgi:hypothetical protein